jgi:hypothetical protein
VHPNVKTYENIGDTNLTTGIYYYIKEKSGKYLRWDGNSESSSMKGLYFDLELRDDYRKEWYLFSLEVSQNNKTFIKNAKTDFLLYETLYLEDKVFKHFIYLENSQFNASHGGFEFILIKTKNENWFNIKAEDDWVSNGYLTSNSQFRAREQSFEFDDFYAIDSTLNESESAEVMFIKAQNQSISSDDYILGTPLTTNTYYCIQTINDKNETVFLMWDGIEYGNYWGLNLHKLNDNQCPNDDKYFFEIKFDDHSNVVMITNKASDKYISIFKDFDSALASFSFALSDYSWKWLTFIISNEDSITIRSEIVMGTEYIYMGNSSENAYSNRINGGHSYYNSSNFTFIKIADQNDSNTGSTDGITDKTESVTEINNETISESVTTSADNIQSSYTTTSTETSTKSKAYNFLYETKNFIILNIFMISKILYFVSL